MSGIKVATEGVITEAVTLADGTTVRHVIHDLAEQDMVGLRVNGMMLALTYEVAHELLSKLQKALTP